MNDNDITPPSRTAGELTLPSGVTVWVQTLNSLQREDCDKQSRRFAQRNCRSLLKGGEDHESMVLEIRALSPDQQATLIASDIYYDIHQAALAAHPEPIEPEQGELTAPAFTEACVAWEAACTDAKAARQAFEEEQFTQAKLAAFRLSLKDRRERCALVFFNREFFKAYTRRMRFETLFRAVRQAEDQLQRYYASAEQIEDADDATQDALWDYYDALDVPIRQIPT